MTMAMQTRQPDFSRPIQLAQDGEGVVVYTPLYV